MIPPDFLSLEDLLEIHGDQITRYGGTLGVRDLGLLQSAIAQPCATFAGQFLHEDIFEMAAAYLFHIARNHAFVDGNKRVGAAAAIVFLEINNVRISAIENEYAELVLGAACGRADKKAIAAFFREHVE